MSDWRAEEENLIAPNGETFVLATAQQATALQGMIANLEGQVEALQNEKAEGFIDGKEAAFLQANEEMADIARERIALIRDKRRRGEPVAPA